MSAGTRSNAALVLSILAVVIAAAGVGYAATKIDGKSIKKRSIPGNRVKNNALTGAQIDEAKLGPVPSATKAGSAGSADRAGTAAFADRAAAAARADNADHATSADSAATAARIGSLTEGTSSEPAT